MLIIALVLAAIGLAALVFAVVTSNALVAWVCVGASLLGVLLLVVDALRERRRQTAGVVAEPVVTESPEAAAVVDGVADVDEAADAVDTGVDDALEATGSADSADSAGSEGEVGVEAEATEASESQAVPATLGEAIGGGFEVDSAD